MAVSVIFMRFISVTVEISPGYLEEIRDANGKLIVDTYHNPKMGTIYPYSWLGMVTALIGVAVLGIGAAIKEKPQIV